MQRRSLLQLLGAAAAASWTPAFAREAADAWQADFDRSAAPWTLGYRTPPGDFAPLPAVVRGRFPDAVRGTLFRVGPAGHDMGGLRYHHWFDGDGMVQRFRLDGDSVLHEGRYVATAKRREEVRAGHRTVWAFGTRVEGAPPPSSPDSMNVANISVLPLGGDLLALWEGGSATRLDPLTLDTLGLKTWRPDLAGLPFSAHPKVDPDGTIWNFGVGTGQSLLVLYEIAPDGELRRADAIPVPDVPMIHDFVVTQRHLVFLMPPLLYDAQRANDGASILDAYVWQPERGMRVLVVDKKDWSRRQSLQLPAGFLFHLGNAWEEEGPQGTVIRLDYVRSDGPDALFSVTRNVMRGRYTKVPVPHLVVARLDLGTGRASQTVLPMEAEFPRIDARRVGLRHGSVIHATQTSGERPGFMAVARTNVETGQSERYVYGRDFMVEEHVFVADTSSADAGWVLGTALDLSRRCTVLSCFAADRLADGPVAQATLPRALPLGLHGAFVPA